MILNLISTLTAQGASYKVLEFHGETIRKMSTSGRIAICNMALKPRSSASFRATETGATCG